MTTLRNCGDCGAKPGERHQHGCDVERCALCGGQAISCTCVYEVNGMSGATLEEEHPEIYEQGATEAMWAKFDEEVARYGGPLLWTGIWPGVEECREFELWCHGPPWIPCSKEHPNATENLNRLAFVAHWNKEQRRWVKR
jgi:hypothetical protein